MDPEFLEWLEGKDSGFFSGFLSFCVCGVIKPRQAHPLQPVFVFIDTGFIRNPIDGIRGNSGLLASIDGLMAALKRC